MKIAIIGSSGMLGKIVFNYFLKFAKNIQLIIPKKYNLHKKNEFISSLQNADFVINCSGSIPQKMPYSKSIITNINYYPTKLTLYTTILLLNTIRPQLNNILL